MEKLDLPEQVAEQPLSSETAQELEEQFVEMPSEELREAQQLALAVAEADGEHYAVPGVSRDSPVRHLI